MLITKDKRKFYDVPGTIHLHERKYDLLDPIGAGGNGSVLECLDDEGKSYAIKFQLNLSDESIKRFDQEIKVHKMIKHPHVINYIDSGTVTAHEVKKDGDRECKIPFLIMEKAEGNLADYLKDRNIVAYSEYIQQFLGLSDALNELHKTAIHRDIKLENILIVGDRWVIGDFGLCSFLDENHEDITRIDEKVGPKYWMSPEAINRIYNSSVCIVPASDVFQLSAVFWFVVTLKYPLGIVTADDWESDDVEIGKVILSGLTHNTDKRLHNGNELYHKLKSVVDSNRKSI